MQVEFTRETEVEMEGAGEMCRQSRGEAGSGHVEARVLGVVVPEK